MTTTAQQGGIRLLLIGGGKMGSAMLGGWLAGELQPSQCLVVEPDRTAAAALRGRHGVAVVGGVEEIADDVTPEMVVLAVKPQVMDDVLPPYRRFVRADTVFVSIAAGKSVTFLERALGDAAIVRAMPNTPAAVGRGITAAFANARVSARQRDAADRRLSAVGEVVWIDDEELINAVTALSGSGPAYVFHMIEAMAAAGVAAGLQRILPCGWRGPPSPARASLPTRATRARRSCASTSPAPVVPPLPPLRYSWMRSRGLRH